MLDKIAGANSVYLKKFSLAQPNDKEETMNKKLSYQEPTLELKLLETTDAIMSSGFENADGSYDNVGRLPGGWDEL